MNKSSTINGKPVIAVGKKIDRKTLNQAKKNYERSKGISYDLRVRNLNNGDSEW